ncbi:MAG: PilN domain-containing protein [Nitrospiria bacterium]
MKREINLITDEFVFDPLGKIKPVLLAGWIFLLIGVLSWLITSKGIEIKKTHMEITQLNDRLSQLSKEEIELQQFIQKNGPPDSDAAFKQSIPWVDILSAIGTIVPEGAWLKNFEGGIKQDVKDRAPINQIKMTGFAYSNAPITILLSRLERQSLFSDIHLIYTEKAESLDDHYVHFEITGRLN